jgi:hypothetical protein
MAPPELPPLGPPPRDLDDRDLVVVAWSAPCYRVHAVARNPLHFGRDVRHRFDDPRGEFGVLYASSELAGAFRETFAGVSSVTISALSARAWSELVPSRPLRLCDLTAEGLSRIGADARLTTGERGNAQDWSRALYTHHEDVDGLLYRARTDPSIPSLAVFDRAAGALGATRTVGFLAPEGTSETARILERYRVALVPG